MRAIILCGVIVAGTLAMAGANEGADPSDLWYRSVSEKRSDPPGKSSAAQSAAKKAKRI